jgi:hypothetical protein
MSRAQWSFLHATDLYVDFEGAVRSGKTSVAILKVSNSCLDHPGIHWMLSRWTQDATDAQLRPRLRELIPSQHLGPWNAQEQYFEIIPQSGPRSRVYVRGLRASEESARYCVAPETKVLKSDLSWVDAVHVQAGDLLVGVDEEAQGQGAHRRLRVAVVEATRVFEDDRFEVITTQGRVIVNAVHPFLVARTNEDHHQRWVETRHLQSGMPIKFLGCPWEDRADSWLAGLLDGEGCVVTTPQKRIAAISQNPGPVLEKAKSILVADGIGFQVYQGSNHKTVSATVTTIQGILRLLGSYRPIRLLPKGADLLDGRARLPQKDDKAYVLEIRRVSRGPVVGIQTSTRTLITNGFISHNSKFAGLTLAGIYIDQPEELPHDFYQALQARLSQPGYPHQMLLTPNPPDEGHWLAKEFPTDNTRPDHRYIRTTVYDNRKVLGEPYIKALEEAYPAGSVLRRRFIDGIRGLSVIGEPVYAGYFSRRQHEVEPLVMNPEVALLEAWDFGHSHPCVIWAQILPWGSLHVLGGVMGEAMFLEDFAPAALAVRQTWFPHAVRIDSTGDPAGDAKSSQGTNRSAADVLRTFGVRLDTIPSANHPDKRNTAIQAVAGYMRRLSQLGPAFKVTPRFRVISGTAQRSSPVLVDGLEAGYVWDDKSTASTSNPSTRRPKKDGFYDHAQNCLEYLVLRYGPPVEDRRPKTPVAVEEGRFYVGPTRDQAGWMAG